MYREAIHSGTQPIRVVHHMLVYMFQNTYPEFFDELLSQIENRKVSNHLGLQYGQESIKAEGRRMYTPRINFETRQIEIHETFLSFLWCSTYSIFVTYVETIDYPRVNRENGIVTHPVSQDNIEQASEVFDYARYIIAHFDIWDKEILPNPEIYLAEKRDYVEQTNVYYTEAVKFILLHEFTHLRSHREKVTPETQDSHYIEFEWDADNASIDMMIRGASDENNPFDEAKKLAIENGIIFGILSMFFFNASTKVDEKHPNTEDRLTNALERLKLGEMHFAWGIACVGLKFWAGQFGILLEWNDGLGTYRHQYYDVITQIKKLHR